jgi:hypothetical protein
MGSFAASAAAMNVATDGLMVRLAIRRFYSYGSRAGRGLFQTSTMSA